MSWLGESINYTPDYTSGDKHTYREANDLTEKYQAEGKLRGNQSVCHRCGGTITYGPYSGSCNKCSFIDND